ncbi:uncharacterized protein CXorf38-like isoform X2 [Heptranchias perlo]|uniref:uncharacterized protein CXorf38-like isoform X2 n=1 Tax=Heptranchias perlo TaxID=212740 RepID=UPI00355A36D9
MQSELNIRLNDEGYKNWIKAGFCLQKTRDCLLGFVHTEMEKFHRFLLRTNSFLRQGICKDFCRPQGIKFQRACSLCEEWKREILSHHTNQNSMIYWGNCSPPLWPKQAWEVAKVIKCRNDLMHSVEMSVSAEWLDNHRQKILVLLQEFQHIPEAKTASKMIQEITSSNWQVQITGTDAMDTALEVTDEEINAGEIFVVELELIREWVQELCLALEEQEAFPAQHLNSLNMFKEFLKQNKELESVLHKELQQLYTLEKMLKSGMESVNDQDGGKWNPEEKEADVTLDHGGKIQ